MPVSLLRRFSRQGTTVTLVLGNMPWTGRRTRAGKTATAIGLLHGEPNKWRGAHRYGAHWIYVASKMCVAAWMSGLLTSSRKTQTNFHAHGPDASEPYSLSKGTV